MRWSELESLAQLLYRPLYERNLKYGDVNVRDFVTYQASVLYAGETPATRTVSYTHLDVYKRQSQHRLYATNHQPIMWGFQ